MGQANISKSYTKERFNYFKTNNVDKKKSVKGNIDQSYDCKKHTIE